MGDTQHDGGASPRQSGNKNDGQHASYTTHISSTRQYPSAGRQAGASPFHSQISSISSHQQRPETSRTTSQRGHSSYNASPGQQLTGPVFNMAAMAGALPEYMVGSPSSAGQTPQYHQSPPGGNAPGAAFQSLQYPVPTANPYSGGAVGYGGYGQGHFPPQYGSPTAPHQQTYPPFAMGQPRVNTMQQQLPPYQQMQAPYYFVQGGYGPQTPQAPHLGPYNPTYTGRTGFGGDQEGRLPSESALNAVPRGPPRKPKQSGHALWVGNLPPGATVLDLKEHFSREAIRDIESLFLISKSNCAFVNYRTETACAAAMQRFHDSRFQGVRLVCRLRRTSTAVPGVPSGPAASTPTRLNVQTETSGSSQEELADGVDDETSEPDAQATEAPATSSQPTGSGSQRAAEKFFIIKSLTLQDLEQSVRNGIWATQAHNEEILNRAFESADNVYLVFSANKSGEYFGYARMISPIGDDVPESYESAPQPQAVESTNAPRTIPTPATQNAPKGRIIDDSARGTIFWEAELSEREDEEEDTGAAATTTEPTDGPHADGAGSQAYGKPFRVEWISTNRLPFYRTRGLRNPWNANRDVKIARDGTELEPTVGRKLAQMFHRSAPSPISPTGGHGQMPGFMGNLGQNPYGPQ